jgi:hypothetical protein
MVLEERSTVFINQISRIAMASPLPESWNYNVSWSPWAKLQLQYMGMNASLNARPVKSVTFRASGDRFARVHEWEGTYDESGTQLLPTFSQIINSPGSGRTLRRNVLSNTLSITDSQGVVNERDAEYWIVTAYISVVDSSVTVSSSVNSSVELGIQDATAFANFIGASSAPTGGLAIGESGNRTATISAPGSIRIAAVVYPLLAKRDARGNIFMYIGTERYLANTRTRSR